VVTGNKDLHWSRPALAGADGSSSMAFYAFTTLAAGLP
jgi:hypothetical protein